jgi:hypothetical protein
MTTRDLTASLHEMAVDLDRRIADRRAAIAALTADAAHLRRQLHAFHTASRSRAALISLTVGLAAGLTALSGLAFLF